MSHLGIHVESDDMSLSCVFRQFFPRKVETVGSVTGSICRKISYIHQMEINNGDSLISRPFTVFVEGNIGSGKTTFLSNFIDVAVYSEPTDVWRNIKGHNVLELMYQDPARWAFTFQSLVQKTMLELHVQNPRQTTKLMERSIYSARYCFVENLRNEGLMSAPEYAVIDEWFKWIVRNLSINGDLIVYLRTDPEVAYQRIQQRGRKEESGLSLDYLNKLHKLHDQWLIEKNFPCLFPVIVLDANKEMKEVLKEFETLQPEFQKQISTERKAAVSLSEP